VDRALDQAVEEALVRALRSPAVGRAIERAIEGHAATFELRSEEIALIVKRALESEAAGQVWAEVLASDQAQMLVERVARAPEVRAAIAEQGAGLITDIGVRLTKLTEALDDALERIVRHQDPDSETDQAGLATRLTAATVDIVLLVTVFSIVWSVIASLIGVTIGHLSPAAAIVLGGCGLVIAGGIFVTFWTLVGQTPGMRFLSIRLVQEGSHHVTPRCATRRVFAVVLSLLPLGLGFLAILRDPQRRAWHDRLTGTSVVYDMAARSAPHARTAVSPAADQPAA
jgi:uncharacterized RDD family membrane protein YckC/DNA-binding transcriptional regulator YdaS (Cro superfamily)